MTFAVIAAVATVASAYGSYQSGVAQKSQYQTQAKMATAEGERKQVQFQQRANDVLRRRNEANAAIAARAAAGGVDPFSGSPDIVRAASDTAAGRDYAILLADADAALRGGMFQAEIYNNAGAMAKQRGTFDAIAKLGMAAGGMGDGTQDPAPIRDAKVA
jgi:hypothetical protein